MDHRARRARLRTALETAGLAGLWVTAAADLRWLTGFAGSNGAVLVRVDGPATLATDPRYEGRVTTTHDLDVVIDRDLFAVVVDALADERTGPVGFDPTAASHASALTWFERAGRDRLVAHPGLVSDLRRTKDAAEIARLERACELTVQAWRQVVVSALDASSLVGSSERDVAIAIERRMVDLGADGIAFDSIVATGPNGARPHHEPTDRVIDDGDLVTTDIGALVDGYHADFTRTVLVGEHPSDDRLAQVHDVVVAAQAAGIEALVAGSPIVAADRAARAVVTEAGWGDEFVHGVGHGVGLQVHEDPLIALAGDEVARAGMVVTIEPGVYVPGVGGVRIEDTVVITPDGPRSLTIAPVGIGGH